MPEDIANFAYAWMSALIVLGMAVIAWLLNKGFDSIKGTFKSIEETLKGIRADLMREHDERVALRAEMVAMRRICDERHTIRRTEN